MIQTNRGKRILIAHSGLYSLCGHTTFNLKSQFISISEFPDATQGPLYLLSLHIIRQPGWSLQIHTPKVALEMGGEAEIVWVPDKLSRNIVGLLICTRPIGTRGRTIGKSITEKKVLTLELKTPSQQPAREQGQGLCISLNYFPLEYLLEVRDSSLL